MPEFSPLAEMGKLCERQAARIERLGIIESKIQNHDTSLKDELLVHSELLQRYAEMRYAEQKAAQELQ